MIDAWLIGSDDGQSEDIDHKLQPWQKSKVGQSSRKGKFKRVKKTQKTSMSSWLTRNWSSAYGYKVNYKQRVKQNKN